MISTFVEIKIDEETTKILNRNVILSLSTENKIKVDEKTPSYGIVAATGSVTFKDIDGEFLNYSRNGLLNSGNIPIKIYLKDEISGTTEMIGNWLSKSWQYDVDTKEITVTLKDKIENLQKIEVPNTTTLFPVENNQMSGLTLFNKIKSVTPVEFEFEEIPQAIEDFLLEDVVIAIPYMDGGSLWDFYNRFCEFTLLHMFTDANGKIVLCKIR